MAAAGAGRLHTGDPMPDVFFSYSRRDSDFVRRLAGELRERGKDVWIDVDGVRDTERFPEALRRAIESSDAFVFVISPESVSSEFCEQEVAHAAGLNKRIVPLALRPVSDGEIPGEIRFRNWIPVDGGAPFEAGVERVVAALETDIEWERQHTRMTVRALEWEAAGRDKSFLLRGADLQAGERWLAAGAGKDPGPTSLEQEYMLAARQSATRRQRALVGGSLAIAVVAVGLLIFALISRGQAVSARNAANAAARTAKSRALAAESETQLAVDPERSILLAAAAVRASVTSQAMFALRAAIDASPIRLRLPDVPAQLCGGPADANTPDPLSPGVAFSPGGGQVAEALCDGTVVLASARSGRVVRRVSLGRGVAGRLVYNRASSLLVAVGAGGVAAIDPATGAVLERGPAVGGATAVASNPDAPVVAFAGKHGVTLWNVRTRSARTLALPGGVTAAMLAFSPDGRRLAIALTVFAHQEIVALLLDVRTGHILATVKSNSGLQWNDLAFSPDGRKLVVGEVGGSAGRGVVALLDARTLRLRRVLVRFGRPTQTTAVAFSPDGSRIAYGTAIDGAAAVVSVATGRTIVSYLGDTGGISQIAFSPDGRLVMTGSTDGTVRIWRGHSLELRSAPFNGYFVSVVPLAAGYAGVGLDANNYAIAQLWSRELRPAPQLMLLPSGGPAEVVGSSAGPLAAIAVGNQGSRGRIVIWNVLERRVIRRSPPKRLPTYIDNYALLSPNGTTIAYDAPAGAGWAIHLLDTRTGGYTMLARTSCPNEPFLAFSRDGRLLAAGGACGEADVWNLATGRRVGRAFTVAAGSVIGYLAFSPDGRQLALPASDDAVTVINPLTGAKLAVLNDHTRRVEAAAYSPNGRYLVTASDDGTADIYDAHSFTLLRTIHNGAAVRLAVFSADSRDLFTWDWNGVLAEWDACTDCENPRALLALAATRVTRQLTPSERRTFAVG